MHPIRRVDQPGKSTPPGVPPSTPASQVGGGQFAARVAEAEFALFTPLHYEPRYPYPLLVWLHGPGASEQQLRKIMPLVSLRNYTAVGVRGTISLAGAPQGGGGFTWSQSAGDIALAEQRVFDLIDEARGRFHIHAGRVFLAGFDSGGTMALRIAMSHPGVFAGVLSLCGELPAGHNPLLRLTELRRLPVLLAAGQTSRRYPVEQLCREWRLLHAAGVPVTPREYPCGQQLDPAMLADVDRWIMQHVTGAASSEG